MPNSSHRPRKRRTRQHVIADLGVHHVEGFILEAGYTAEQFDSDYSYDLVMRTFDEEGYAEPGSVYIQVKASESFAAAGANFHFDVDLRDYNLWIAEPFPVILVLFDVSRRAAFWLALHEYFKEDAPAAERRQDCARARAAIPDFGWGRHSDLSALETQEPKAETEDSTMKRSDVTFAQLDKVLREFGFCWRPASATPPGRIYEHESGALVALKRYRANERVYNHHLYAARTELDHFGIADPTTFDAKLQKAG
jgi:hypothetical protein